MVLLCKGGRGLTCSYKRNASILEGAVQVTICANEAVLAADERARAVLCSMAGREVE